MTPEMLDRLEGILNRCLEPVLFDVLIALKSRAVPVVRVDVEAVDQQGMTRLAMLTRQEIEVVEQGKIPELVAMMRADGYHMLARWIESQKKDRVLMHFGNAVYALEYTGAKFIPLPELTGGGDKIVSVRKK